MSPGVSASSTSTRPSIAGPVIVAVASASFATRAAATAVPISVLTRRRIRSSTPRAKVSPRRSVSASGERATPPCRSFLDSTLAAGGIGGLSIGRERQFRNAMVTKA